MTSPIGISLPDVIASKTGASGAVVRTGIVVNTASGFVTVRVSGSTSLTNAPYLVGQYQPALGDIVAMLNFGSQWIVLGELSNNPEDNPVTNYSFESGDTLIAPVDWTVYLDPSNTMTITVTQGQMLGTFIDGYQILRVDCDPSVSGTHLQYQESEATVISSSFKVNPGEVWGFSAWLTGYGESKGTTFDAYARFGMFVFTNAADNYPAVTPVGSVGTGLFPVPHDLQWTRMATSSIPAQENGYVIPDGGNWGRLWADVTFTRDLGSPVDGIIYSFVGNFPVLFDRMVARRID